MEIAAYKSQWKQNFINLNLEWIEKYFKAEPQDIEMLNNVEELIRNGAAVFFALEQERPIAVCMIVPRKNHIWEICKLATAKEAQGKGAGWAVLEKCMNYAKDHGARKLLIVSNKILSAAMHLYAKAGFKEVPIDYMEYERVNIQLEKTLA